MSKPLEIAVVKGDGIGIAVTDATIAMVDAALKYTGAQTLNYRFISAGATYYQDTGLDIEAGGENACGDADAILLGAIGLPSVRWPDGTELVPHLRLREIFQLYAGIRPVKAYPNAPQRLSDPRAAKLDLIILRESTEGLFYSAAVHGRSEIVNDSEVRDVLRITRSTSEKLHRFAFDLAAKRGKRGSSGTVTCVDKANVFASMALFRKVFDEVASEYPGVEHSHNYVDAQALDLIRQPWNFDVLVMENMFGDILSDLAGGLVGGMGVAPCAEIGDENGLFQPAHGSAPDIMGQDKANPLAAVLSGGLMLDYLADKCGSEALKAASMAVDAAVENGFAQNRLRPKEFGGDMGTTSMTKELVNLVEEACQADQQPAAMAP